jgi:2',3'-cyclic-nucleotide 2'-phosphodiesterase (5'-nucleotidase family)
VVSIRRLFLCALCLCFAAGSALASPVSRRVTILFFNDLHGHLESFTVKQLDKPVEVGGISRIAALVKKIREENDKNGAQTLLFVAGDILQGTPMSTVFMGEPDVLALNEIGVNAMAVGNHEFDFGLDNLLALKKLAKFPIISSNIVWKDGGELVFDPFAVFEVSDNVTLTVIGATTRELLTTTKPSNVERVDALNSVETVQKYYAPAIRKGPVILLSHSRAATDSLIAAATPGLAAVIGGHDQVLFNPYRTVGDVPVFQAFEKGKFLGRIDFLVDPASGNARIASWGYIPITTELDKDPVVEELVRSYSSRLDAKFKEVIGENREFLDGERERIRYEETNLGDWVTDIMREFTGADAALINAGGLRASIDRGPVTVESVFKAMPYENELLVVRLTGAELLAALTRSVRGAREEEDGGFLHVSGIRFKIEGKVPREVVLGGRPIDEAATYEVAITDFMFSGGDGYDLFAGKSAVDTGLPLRELIVDTVRKTGVIDVRTDGRISRTGG